MVTASNTPSTRNDVEDLRPMSSPSGSDAQRVIAMIRARLTARYKLTAVPGRPEELSTGGLTDRRVSLGYGCKTIRIRRQQGREWIDRIDIQIKEDWHAEVYTFLDPHFEWRQSVKVSSNATS